MFFLCKPKVVCPKRLVRAERTVIAIVFVGGERAFLTTLHRIVFSVGSFAVPAFWSFPVGSQTSKMHPVDLVNCNANSSGLQGSNKSPSFKVHILTIPNFGKHTSV